VARGVEAGCRPGPLLDQLIRDAAQCRHRRDRQREDQRLSGHEEIVGDLAPAISSPVRTGPGGPGPRPSWARAVRITPAKAPPGGRVGQAYLWQHVTLAARAADEYCALPAGEIKARPGLVAILRTTGQSRESGREYGTDAARPSGREEGH